VKRDTVSASLFFLLVDRRRWWFIAAKCGCLAHLLGFEIGIVADGVTDCWDGVGSVVAFALEQ
jgi:hypothetical protein